MGLDLTRLAPWTPLGPPTPGPPDAGPPIERQPRLLGAVEFEERRILENG